MWSVLLAISIYVARSQTPPNFVFLVADDLGWNDVGFHEATNAYTPTLDALKKEALELNRFYVYSKCAPTRSSFWTGNQAHRNSMQHKVGLTSQMACGIKPSSSNLFWPQRLESCQNYQHHLIGKWHVGFFEWEQTPTFRGFDSFLGFYQSSVDYFTLQADRFVDYHLDTTVIQPTTGDYATNIWADRAIHLIQEIAASTDPQPFTLTVMFNAPHAPIHSIQPYLAQAMQNKVFSGDSQNRISYVSMLRAMDARIADIITALKGETINGEPIWDNTWLWFFSDNGPVTSNGNAYPLRGGKATLFEGGIRAPALVAGGLLPSALQGTSTDQLVHITDIYPTLCTQSGADCSDLQLDGMDLTALLTNTAGLTGLENRQIVLNVDATDCAGQYNGATVCGGVVKDYGQHGIFKAVIGNQITGSSSKFGWVELGSQSYQNAPTVNCGGTQPDFNRRFLNNDCANNNRVCLFNLATDPCEYQDLSGDAAYSDILSELMSILQTEYDRQPSSFFDICSISDQATITAASAQAWIPWAEQYYNDVRYSLANTVQYADACPVFFSF